MLQDPRVAWEGDKWDVGGASGMAASRDGNLVRHRFAAKMKTPLLLPPFGFFCLVCLLFVDILCFPRAQLSVFLCLEETGGRIELEFTRNAL